MNNTLAESRDAKAAHMKSDAELEAKRAEIRELLASTQFPVDGMRYDQESRQITILDIPFSNASQGERLRVAAAVAMAGAPRIKAIFVREGSLLDGSSLKVLAEIASANGYQLWIEIVDEPNPETGARAAGIWIEDGEAVTVE